MFFTTLAEQIKELKETVNLLLAYDAVDSKHHDRVENGASPRIRIFSD
jgi:hypothetical protein